MAYKQIAKKNRIEILKKLGFSCLEFSEEVFNSLMLHFDGLVSISVKEKKQADRYDSTCLIRYEKGNDSWRYCIGLLHEYDNCMLWREEI